MKVLIFTLFLSFSLQAKEVLVDVPGMVCQMCVYGMKKHFKTAVNNPDKDIIVDLDKKTVRVNLNTEITNENIKERVKKAGYEAGKITWIDTSKKQ